MKDYPDLKAFWWALRMAESNRLEPELQGNFWKDDRWWAWFRDSTQIAGEQPVPRSLLQSFGADD